MQFAARKQNNTRHIQYMVSLILRSATMKCAVCVRPLIQNNTSRGVVLSVCRILGIRECKTTYLRFAAVFRFAVFLAAFFATFLTTRFAVFFAAFFFAGILRLKL